MLWTCCKQYNETLASKFYIFVVSCLKVICWALIIYTHYRCIRFDIIICIIMTYSVYIIKNYHTGCYSIRLRRFVCRLRRISTSTSTNFNSTSTNFNSTSTNLYSTLTIFSQLRRIWIETDICTYENYICVVEMICTCS